MRVLHDPDGARPEPGDGDHLVDPNADRAHAVVDQEGGSGSWFVQTGAISPSNSFDVSPPTHGEFAHASATMAL